VTILALLLLMAGSTGEAGKTAPQPIAIEVAADNQQQCVFRIEERTLSQTALRKFLKAERDKQREIQISSASNAPWRCIAGAVYDAQESGFETVGFVTPPPVSE
jgi:biopolymer transport protein ExbD